MHPALAASLLASVFNGGAVTIVWIIGIILIIAGVVSLFRGSVAPRNRADRDRGAPGRPQCVLAMSSPRVLDEVTPNERLARGSHRDRHRAGRRLQSTTMADHTAEMVEQIAGVWVRLAHPAQSGVCSTQSCSPAPSVTAARRCSRSQILVSRAPCRRRGT